MPITTERLYALLAEHEKCLSLARDLQRQLNDPYLRDSATSFEIIALVHSVLDKLPDTFALIERKHYNSHARRNATVRERSRQQRRAHGVPERSPPPPPSELFTRSAPIPSDAELEIAAATGHIDDAAREAEEFLRTHPQPTFVPQFEEVKTEEQIAAENAQLLEGL